MNRTHCAIILFPLVLSLHASAQPSSDAFLTEHSKAIQFQVSNNFTLSSFQGSTLSYKQHLTPYFAVRAGLGVSFNNSTTDQVDNGYSNDSLVSFSKTGFDRSGVTLQLNTQAIWYTESSSEILFFYGTGPLVSYARSRQSQESVTSTSDQTSTQWSAGLSVLAGVEWFASKSISLHAEYGISGSYSSTKYESTSNVPTTRSRGSADATTTGWSISSNSVRLGLSIYFQ